MKEEWLLNGAAVPVTCETVVALVAEIHRLIGVVGGMALARPAPVQERVADGLIRQYINSVVSNNPDEAANVTKAMVDYVYATPQAQRTWVGLTEGEAENAINEVGGFAFGLNDGNLSNKTVVLYVKTIEEALRKKNL